MAESWEMRNATAELERRRAENGHPVKAVADIAGTVQRNAEASAEPYTAPEPRRQVVPRATLDSLDTSHPLVKQAVDMVRAWAERKRQGELNASLVLCGPVGTGKTHLARVVLWSIAYTLDNEPVSPAGIFWHATDLLMKLNPTRNDWGGVESARPSQFIGNAPIIVIDDVGSEQSLPYIKADEQAAERAARYFRVIDYCYTFGVSVVITSNLAIAQLGDHMGRRAWDRLNEMAPRGFMMDLQGVPSWRMKASGR